MAYQAMWAPSETHRRHSCLRIAAIKGTKGTLSFLYLLLISFFTSYFLDTSASALPSFLSHLFSCLLSPFRLLLPCSYEFVPPFVPLDKVIRNPSIVLFFSGLHKNTKVVWTTTLTTFNGPTAHSLFSCPALLVSLKRVYFE